LAFWSNAIRLTGISLMQCLKSIAQQLSGVDQMSVGLVVFDKKAWNSHSITHQTVKNTIKIFSHSFLI
jgi:hypothetical protein